ncbi:PFGI-1 class ICE element type IV pilus protein PilL2 [Salinisphaera orenii]|uniref:PFGI-1 class ICE element type IV pilus protein PilL2 n=1 Tax=Salinisphaera orenii TaxID=856731 RepID=UPI0013A67C05
MAYTTHNQPAALLIGVAGLLLLTAGCASTPDPATNGHAHSDTANTSRPSTPTQPARRYQSNETRQTGSSGTEAVRTSRYQLVTLSPQDGQRNLLKQTISMNLPDGMNLTVADGLKHALDDSGLRLCNSAAHDGRFNTPLPAVDRNLGPTTLGNALKVLAGPAWSMHTDFAKRRVCFHRRDQPPTTPEPTQGGGRGHELADTHHE